MSFIYKVDAIINSSIEDTKYSFEIPKEKKVSNFITIDWEGIIPEPPSNESEITKDELEYLSKLTRMRTPEDEELVRLVDKHPIRIYEEFARKHKLKIPMGRIEKAIEIITPIILNLKWKHNRPRPFQLARFYGLNIDVIKTDTHQTPAYPSGHTAQAGIIAPIMAEEYPKYTSEFYELVSRAGLARCLQGVHYPTDNDVSMVISGAVWEDIRHRI